MSYEHMSYAQVRILLTTDPTPCRGEEIVEMPPALGSWVQTHPTRDRWVFELSAEGEDYAAFTRDLSDAANASMIEYRCGEHSSCLPGVFRDAFVRGYNYHIEVAAKARKEEGQT